ncbi:patatin-like phospholipase family protein [Rhizobium halophilum]|uniref:patatin-like phospholipase family protein n=1 Tax=Rhizobium halophilum TaxID=2846852 RepID=UPI001EFEEEF1|nr:patatin-like phospholipase family protein [Rhizobium halophilum]MCF6371028.1 patatin-like phospholipase family protein [Rhizobium halophilum]
MVEREREIWLCLSGGNALGAYHAGAYEALAAAGATPTRIAGASIGAIMGALIAGNAPEDRVTRLRQFWDRAAQYETVLPPGSFLTGRMGEWLSLLQTLAYGRSGLFRRTLPSLLPLLPGTRSSAHLFDTSPLRKTLCELVDFGRLSGGPVRLLVTAVDVETGEDVIFDSHAGGIEIDHVMASAAFPIAFPPVRVDERVCVDAGVSANLPIVPLFTSNDADNVLCLALDLITARGKVPDSLDDAVKRAQDLVFASQSRHALRAVTRSAPSDSSAKAAIVHLCYNGNDQEIGGKFFEFSAQSVRRRWSAGKAETEKVLAARADFDLTEDRSVYRLQGYELKRLS